MPIRILCTRILYVQSKEYYTALRIFIKKSLVLSPFIHFSCTQKAKEKKT